MGNRGDKQGGFIEHQRGSNDVTHSHVDDLIDITQGERKEPYARELSGSICRKVQNRQNRAVVGSRS